MSGNIRLLVLLAVGTVFTAFWLALLRKQITLQGYLVVPLAVLHTLYGLFTVKAFAFLEAGFDSDSLGSMSLFGGVFLMPLAYFLGARLFKRPPGKVFDVFTPCMIFTLLCARVNCLFAGCCRGRVIPGSNGVRFPTRELEILFYAVFLLCLCPRIFREKTRGRCYLLYMISYGAFRFLTEFFRDADTPNVFHMGHLWAGITLLLGISIYAEINSQKSITKKRGRT